jgi:hypothetical protein
VLLQPVDAADQRALARARRAADDDALARATVEVDVAQHMEVVAVPLVDLVEGDDGFAHGGRRWGGPFGVFSACLALVDLLLDPQAVARHREAEGEIDGGDEQVGLDLERPPVGVGVERQPSAPVSSYRLTMVTSEVSLKRLMKLFMMLGTTIASACGSTILRCVCQ